MVSLSSIPGFQACDSLREQADHLNRLVETESARRFGQRLHLIARGSGALVASAYLDRDWERKGAAAPVEMLIEMPPRRNGIWWAGWAERLGVPVPGLGRRAQALADLAPGSEFLREHARDVRRAEALRERAAQVLAQAPWDLPPELARDLAMLDAERQAIGCELSAAIRFPQTAAWSARQERAARELDQFGREVSRAAEAGNSLVLASALTAARERAKARLADLDGLRQALARRELRSEVQQALTEAKALVWRTVRLPELIPELDAPGETVGLERALEEWEQAAGPTAGERVLDRVRVPPVAPPREGPGGLSPAAIRVGERAESWGKVRQRLRNVERDFEGLVFTMEKTMQAAQASSLAARVHIYAGDLRAEVHACGRVPDAALDELESRGTGVGSESDRFLRTADLLQKTRVFQTACQDLQEAVRDIDPEQKIIPPVIWAYLKTLHTTAAGVVAEQAVHPAALEEGVTALQAAGRTQEWQMFSRTAARRADREWAQALEDLRTAGGKTWMQILCQAQQTAEWAVSFASARAAWEEAAQAAEGLTADLHLAQCLTTAGAEEQRVKRAWTRSENGETAGMRQSEDALMRILALSRKRRRLLAGVQRSLAGRLKVLRRLDTGRLAAAVIVLDGGGAYADVMWALARKQTQAISELKRRVQEQNTALGRIAREQEEADEKLELLVQASARLHSMQWMNRLDAVKRALMEAQAGQQAVEREQRHTARARDTVERLQSLAAENTDLARTVRTGDVRLGAALDAWHRAALEAERIWTQQTRPVSHMSADETAVEWSRVAQVGRVALAGLDALSSTTRAMVGESRARRALTACAKVGQGPDASMVRRFQNDLWAIGDATAWEGAGLETLVHRLGRRPGPVDEAVRTAASVLAWAGAAGTLDLARSWAKVETDRTLNEARYAAEHTERTASLDRITSAEREVERVLYGSDGETRRWLETSGLYDRWREAEHASRNVELMADALAGEGLARMLTRVQSRGLGDPVYRRLEEDRPGRQAPDWMTAGMRARWRRGGTEGERVQNALDKAQEAGLQAVVWAALEREISRELSAGGAHLQRQVERLHRRSAQAARQMAVQARAGRAERRLRSLSTRVQAAVYPRLEGLKARTQDFQRALKEDGPSDDLAQEYCRDRAEQELEEQRTGLERLRTDWQDQLSGQSLELHQARVLSLFSGVDRTYRDLGTSLQKVLDQTGPDPAWERASGQTLTGDLLAQISADHEVLVQVEQALADQVLAKHPALRELRRQEDLHGKLEQLKGAGEKGAEDWYARTQLGEHLDRLTQVRAEVEAYLTRALTGQLAAGEMKRGLDLLLRRWSVETAYVSAALNLAPHTLRARQRDLLLTAERDRFKAFPGLLNGQRDQLAADMAVQAQSHMLTRTLGSMNADVASLWDHLSGRSDLDLTEWMQSLNGHASALASTGQALAAQAHTWLSQLGIPVNCTRFLQSVQGVYQASLDDLGQSVVRVVAGAAGGQSHVPVLNFALTGAGSGAARTAGEFIFPQKGISDLFDPNALWERIARLVGSDQWQFDWVQGLDGMMRPVQELGQEALDQGLSWLGDRWGRKDAATGAELGGPEHWLKKLISIRYNSLSEALDPYLPEAYQPAKSKLGQVTFNGDDAEVFRKLARYFQDEHPETVRRGRELYKEAMTLKRLLSMSEEMQGGESLGTLDSLNDILDPKGKQAVKDHAEAGRTAWSLLAGGSLSTVPTTSESAGGDKDADGRVLVFGSGAYRKDGSSGDVEAMWQEAMVRSLEKSIGRPGGSARYGDNEDAGGGLDVAQYVGQGSPRGPSPVKEDRRVKDAQKNNVAESGEYDNGRKSGTRSKANTGTITNREGRGGFPEDGAPDQRTAKELDLEPAQLGPNRIGIPRPEGEGGEERKNVEKVSGIGESEKENFWERGWNGAKKLLKEAAAIWVDPRRLNPRMTGPDQVEEKAGQGSEQIAVPEHKMSEQAKLAELREKFPKGIFDPKARAAAIEQIEKDRLGYLAGYQYWEDHRTSKGESSNNVLLVEDGNQCHRVYRWVEKGQLKVIRSEVLKDREEFEAIKADNMAKRTTWCNFAARVFGEKYTVSESFNNKELLANDISKGFNGGQFNGSKGCFKEVEWQRAERYAKEGGLAYVVYKGETNGHIATIMGGYEGAPSVLNMKLYQAGRRFDGTLYRDGFKGIKPEHVQMYIWEKP